MGVIQGVQIKWRVVKFQDVWTGVDFPNPKLQQLLEPRAPVGRPLSRLRLLECLAA
jgi:hypothetical protein